MIIREAGPMALLMAAMVSLENMGEGTSKSGPPGRR
jgi:hypothetical protein